MTENKELKDRVIKGIEYFWTKKPSELNYVELSHWTTFLKLLRIYINGEDIHIKTLSEKSRMNETYMEAKEIFK